MIGQPFLYYLRCKFLILEHDSHVAICRFIGLFPITDLFLDGGAQIALATQYFATVR